MMKFDTNRKSFVRMLAAGTAMAALGCAGAAAQDAGPVKIGLIFSKQGPGASIGQFLQRGAELAAQQAGMKAMGRPVELIWLDEAGPEGSQQNMQRLQVKKMIAQWELKYPGRTESIFSALRNVAPSHLADPAAYDFAGLESLRTAAADAVPESGLEPWDET